MLPHEYQSPVRAKADMSELDKGFRPYRTLFVSLTFYAGLLPALVLAPLQGYPDSVD